MEAEFWHQKWEEQQLGFHLGFVNPLLEKFWPSLNLDDNAKVFVPLCGKTLDLLYLAQHNKQVIGCELSEIGTKQFFTENQLTFTQQVDDKVQRFSSDNICIIQGDFFNLASSLTRECNAFYDRGSLIALPEAMRQSYVKQLAKLINSGAKGILITLDYHQDKVSGPPFAVSDAWVQQYLADEFDINLLNSELIDFDNPRFIKNNVDKVTQSVYQLTRK